MNSNISVLSQIPSLARRLRSVVLIVFVGWLAATPHARADIRTYVGGSGNWSTPSNWSPAGPPQNGDDLVFNNSPSSNLTNDIVGLSVRTLEFHHSGAVWGPNALTITVGINAFSADNGPLAMNFPQMVLGGDVSVDANDGTGWGCVFNCQTVLGGHTLTCYAVNSGSSAFQSPILGPGKVIFASGTNYLVAYNGPSSAPMKVAAGGGLSLGGLGTPAVLDPLEIDTGATVLLTADNAIGNTVPVTILGGGQLLLAGHTDSIGSLVLSNYFGDGLACTVDATGAGLLGINGGITSWNDSTAIVPVIRGRLNLVGYESIYVGGSGIAGLNIQAAIGGNGFQKFGAGTLRITGNNTYSGDVEAIEGTIEADSSTAFGQAGPSFGVHLEGGNIALENVAIGSEPLFVNSSNSQLLAIGQCSWSGPVSLGTSLNVVPVDPTFGSKTMDFYGAISGSGGLNLLPAIFGVGSVRLLGSAGNLFTGPTVVGCSLLQLGKPSGVNAYAGPLIVGNPGGSAPCEVRWLNSYQNVGATATLYANGIININNWTEDFGPVTFNGGEVDTGTGTFNIYAPLTVNPAPSSAVINGYLGLPPGDNRVFIVGDGASDCDLVVNAVIFGTPGTYFVKQGAGTMCLTAANTYDTVTLLEEGILDINNSSGLGSWAGLVIFDGATIRLSGSGNGNGFEAIGAGVGGTHGAVEVVANASWNIVAGMLLDGPTTFNVGTSSGLGLNAPISSSGPGCSVIKTGAGVLSFAGTSANTYSGDTVINAGQCYLSKSANVISVPGNLIIGPGPAGPVTFVRLAQTGGMGGGSVTVNGNSLFDLFGYNQTLTQITLNDGGSVQTSGGTLTLPNGTLVRVGSLDPILGSRATSTIGGSIFLPFSGNITFSVNPFLLAFIGGPELDVPAVISGGVNHGITATLIKQGYGRMRLSGNNTFPGYLSINVGAVIAANANALGSTLGATSVNNGAQLILDGGVNIAGEYIILDSTNVPALESTTGPNILGGVLHLNRNSQVGPMSPTETLLANCQIDGPGSLTKVGLGTLSLGGPTGNTFAGETFVNQGTLLLNKPIAVTAIPTALEIGALDDSTAGTARNLNSYQIVGNIYVHSRGLYDVYGQVENTDALVMYGNGDVETGAGYVSLKTGAPIFVYPGSNTTSVINGTLMLDPGNHVMTIGSGATAPGVQDLVINAVIGETSSGGALQKEGAGRMRLTANNSYTGTTIVNAGTLQVDGSQPQSTIYVQGGGRLQGNGTVANLNYTGVAGTIAPGASPGTLTCSSFNPGAFGTGTLEIELNGLTPGSGYDQVHSSGSVWLNGVTLDARLNFASAVSNQFTIILKDNSGPVNGTFTGLPQGTNFYIGGQLFYIDYAGGNGNDVVLTRLPTPTPPTLAISSLSASSFVLSWPTNDPAFSLQSSTDLTANNWTPVSPPPVIVGGNFVVSNAPSGPQKFFRLVR